MSTHWFSLRRRLLLFLLGGVLAAWLAMVSFSYVDAHHEVDELFDAQLAQAAQALLTLSDQSDRHAVEKMGAPAHKYQSRLRSQIWRADGTLLLRSGNALTTPLTTVDGFSETWGNDGHWRHFSQWNEARSLQVQVSEDHRVRDELIGNVAWRLSIPVLLGLPLLGLWIWLATRRSMSVLDGVAARIAAQVPQQLHVLEPKTAPDEIRPLLEALNGLLLRIDEALATERRFTADAAHELRTPLAALLAQAQVARRARSEEELGSSLDMLQSGLVRASHLVEQMLQLARLDPESALPDPQPVELAELAESVCAELGPLIIGKNMEFELSAMPGCIVFGQSEWLRVLVRNLLDNAIRYTPEGGQLRVVVEKLGEICRLAVIDSGPGIPVHEREAVRRRFHRLDQGGQPGSGLGLAIVTRIAELHGASFALADGDNGTGLTASVSWAGKNSERE